MIRSAYCLLFSQTYRTSVDYINIHRDFDGMRRSPTHVKCTILGTDVLDHQKTNKLTFHLWILVNGQRVPTQSSLHPKITHETYDDMMAKTKQYVQERLLFFPFDVKFSVQVNNQEVNSLNYGILTSGEELDVVIKPDAGELSQ